MQANVSLGFHGDSPSFQSRPLFQQGDQFDERYQQGYICKNVAKLSIKGHALARNADERLYSTFLKQVGH